MSEPAEAGDFPKDRGDKSSYWEDCWEYILRLPIETRNDAQLYEEAKRVVQAIRCCAGDAGMAWFADQVEDAQLFVAEQLADDRDDREWQRIDAVLAGAHAACGAGGGPRN